MKISIITKMNTYYKELFSKIPEYKEPEKLLKEIEKKNNYFTITLEPVQKQKTLQQIKTFHLLVTEYWKSSLSSLPNWQSIKDSLKYKYGAGFESFTFKFGDDLIVLNPEDEVPESAELKSWELKSCANYSIDEMMRLINSTIREMIEAGVNSKRFQEISKEFIL